MTTLRYLLVALLFAAFMAHVEAGCTIQDDCTEYGGSCVLQSDDCNGNLYRKGCKGKDCGCCVTNTTICIAKPKCENEDGKCKKISIAARVGDNAAFDNSGCHGDDCVCRMNGKCTSKAICSDNDGYCFLQDSNHVCVGTDYHKGCENSNCSCCIADTSICFEKPKCENENGHCVTTLSTDWVGVSAAFDNSGCQGDDCVCQMDGKCTPTAACTATSGYCYRTSGNHKCTTTSDPSGCTGETDCACCSP